MSRKGKLAREEKSVDAPLPVRKKKRKWPIIIVLMLIIAGAGYYFRVPLLHKLSELPVIGKYIPSMQEQEELLSSQELSEQVKKQEQEIEKLKAELETAHLQNTQLSEQNSSLKQYETMYTEFMEQKEKWDETVARTNPELFIQQFESVYPDAAERIYQALKGEKVLSDQQKTLSKTVAGMDEDQAAQALELLVLTDPELIQAIFEGMSADQKSLILSAMTSEGAAQVIKLISPDATVNIK